jgi:hypothetical protein
MKKISSKITFFHKKVFPTIWFGFLGVFLVINGSALLVSTNGLPSPFLLLPVGMGVLGYFLFKNLVFNLMDEVFDGGDYLLVKKGDEEARIQLTNIISINYSVKSNPRRATLTLRDECTFGKEVSFLPANDFTLRQFPK